MAGHALTRQWWWSIAVVGVLSGCSAATPTPSASPTAVPIPSATAIVNVPPLSTPTSTPTPLPFLAPVGPTCSARDLTMRSGISGQGAGSQAVVLVFTDEGPGRCTLRGTPEVRFLDRGGQVVKMAVVDEPGGFFPPTPNSGVGLEPLANSGQMGAAGIRGQAGLEITWASALCAPSAPITRVEITLPTGSLSVPLQIFGFGTTGCFKPGVTVTPFEAAEAVA
jgi:hypothetical protein